MGQHQHQRRQWLGWAHLRLATSSASLVSSWPTMSTTTPLSSILSPLTSSTTTSACKGKATRGVTTNVAQQMGWRRPAPSTTTIFVIGFQEAPSTLLMGIIPSTSMMTTLTMCSTRFHFHLRHLYRKTYLQQYKGWRVNLEYNAGNSNNRRCCAISFISGLASKDQISDVTTTTSCRDRCSQQCDIEGGDWQQDRLHHQHWLSIRYWNWPQKLTSNWLNTSTSSSTKDRHQRARHRQKESTKTKKSSTSSSDFIFTIDI